MIAGLGLLVGCGVEGPGLEGESEDDEADESDTSESDTSESDTSESDTSASDTSASDTSESDTDEPASFDLVAAAIESPTAIVLTFSQPIGSLEGVEADAFRISYAHSERQVYEGNVYAYTWYVDPNVFMVDPDCEPIYGDICPEFEAHVVLGLEPGPIPEQLRLLTSVLDDAACDKIDYEAGFPPEPPFEFETHLFPHYAPGPTPLRSSGGLELAAIGPEWVLFEGDPLFEGGGSLEVVGWGFENLDPAIPIPCE
ncbi:hypothetical protein ACNOYE_18555 [Nannocystaceae bacterium ST9]